LKLELISESRCQQTAQSTSPLIDVDVYTSIVCDASFRVDTETRVLFDYFFVKCSIRWRCLVLFVVLLDSY